jgi:hypothetical protein
MASRNEAEGVDLQVSTFCFAFRAPLDIELSLGLRGLQRPDSKANKVV